jgi:predicted O-linked N-acetylglucosamine transferase (SPINDLY family)
MKAKGDPVSAVRALLDANAPEQALIALDSAGARASTNPELLLSYADALDALGRSAEARALLEEAGARLGSAALFIRAAGLAMAGADRASRDQSLAAALALEPESVATRRALGDAAADDGDPERAVVEYERALALTDPRVRPVLLLLALAAELRKICRDDRALELLARADRGAATNPAPHSALLMHRHYVSPDATDDAPTRRAALLLTTEEHRRFGRRFGTVYRVAAPSQPREKRRRVRVGYLSIDLNNHSVARFFAPILSAHDTERFELILYSTTLGHHDDVTLSLASRARLVDLRAATPAAVAAAIASDAPDVLVDLSGHTAPYQLLALAQRLAPLQLTFLGYPDVTGLPEVDGFVTDAVCSPESADAFGVERLVRMPHAAWTFEGVPESVARGRAPADHVALGALHNLAKLSDSMFDVWGRILARLPSARLVLSVRSKTDEARSSLSRRLTARGVPVDRVDILPAVTARSEHLDRLRRLDLMLDTFPYSGTTTTCEALAMGVPVVTLAGSTHASRVGKSLLGEVGLEDLVADEPSEYVEKAVALALDGERRAKLRAELPATVRASVLGDAARFTRSLEALFVRELERKRSEPGAELVATGAGRATWVGGRRLVLPGELADPHSFRVVEQERIDEGELARALDAVPPTATVVDVLPNPGLSTLVLTSRVERTYVVDPLPTPTFVATLAGIPSARWSRVDTLPGRARGQVPVGSAWVKTAPLDERVAGDVALIRIGAPGLELEALAGAKRLIAGGAIVLLDRMFAPTSPIAPALGALGLAVMGLVPMLGVVASLDGPRRVTAAWDDQRASVFAISKAARARFGASLGVVDDPPKDPTGEAPVRTSDRQRARGARSGALPPGVGALLAAFHEELAPPIRLAWLRRAATLTAAAVKERPRHAGRRFTHARALLELGALGAIGPVLEPLLDRIDSLEVELDEPFLPLLRRFDDFEGQDGPWARAQCLEGFVKFSAPSSFFHPEDFLALFARFDELGYPDAEMERRECLLRTRFDRTLDGRARR